MVAVVAMQLVRPGHDARTDEPLPRALRGLSAAIAVALVPLGLLLFADPDTGSSLSAWELSELSAKAIGTWLTGIGIIHGVVAVADERSAQPGNAIADLVPRRLLADRAGALRRRCRVRGRGRARVPRDRRGAGYRHHSTALTRSAPGPVTAATARR
jgi:hypothetical protein